MTPEDIMKLADEYMGICTFMQEGTGVEKANKARAALQSAVDALQADRDALAAQLKALQEQEPVASIYISAMGREFDDWKCELPEGRNLLYTAPKALEPLTEKQIDKGQWDDGTESTADFKAGVRFAEKHHKIGGKV